ncbi:hypothetical protein [Roseovarius sp.]|uniref:hypothetical protein n=1 Tax=Roseovarius sp. TaxID=1486281 RepID=UPI00262E09B3|nr:hypothetical protein [Roseovarius sp.]MDM8166434.1 hypothetical protein [Roseovarius sp.]
MICDYLNSVRDHALAALFNGLLPVLGIATLIWIVLRIVYWKSPVRAGTGFLFALVGALIGIFLGSSREPAVQAIVPAIVTLIGGFLAWTLQKEAHGQASLLRGFAREDKKDDQEKLIFVTSLVYVAVASLMLSTATASMWGASMRLVKEDADRKYEEWRYKYENLQIPVETELLRRDAGLPLRSEE